jgi:hypothetical protein
MLVVCAGMCMHHAACSVPCHHAMPCTMQPWGGHGCDGGLGHIGPVWPAEIRYPQAYRSFLQNLVGGYWWVSAFLSPQSVIGVKQHWGSSYLVNRAGRPEAPAGHVQYPNRAAEVLRGSIDASVEEEKAIGVRGSAWQNATKVHQRGPNSTLHAKTWQYDDNASSGLGCMRPQALGHGLEATQSRACARATAPGARPHQARPPKS